jgi:hypothetical protein
VTAASGLSGDTGGLQLAQPPSTPKAASSAVVLRTARRIPAWSPFPRTDSPIVPLAERVPGAAVDPVAGDDRAKGTPASPAVAACSTRLGDLLRRAGARGDNRVDVAAGGSSAQADQHQRTRMNEHNSYTLTAFCLRRCAGRHERSLALLKVASPARWRAYAGVLQQIWRSTGEGNLDWPSRPSSSHSADGLLHENLPARPSSGSTVT